MLIVVLLRYVLSRLMKNLTSRPVPVTLITKL